MAQAARGIRLRHPDLRARGRTCTFTIGSRPYPEPVFCPRCGTQHVFKTYHVQVDGDGVAYVSSEIWAAMKKYNVFAGFELADETRGKPPTQMVGMGGSVQLAPIASVVKLEDLGHG